MKTKKVAFLGLSIALAMILSFVESSDRGYVGVVHAYLRIESKADLVLIKVVGKAGVIQNHYKLLLKILSVLWGHVGHRLKLICV